MPTIGRPALVQADLVLAQGTDARLAFRYSAAASAEPGAPRTPVDLTGWAARAQLRARFGGALWLTLTDLDGITLGGTAGTIRIAIPGSVLAADDWAQRAAGVWDLRLTDPSGKRVRFAAGTVSVAPAVTRDA